MWIPWHTTTTKLLLFNRSNDTYFRIRDWHAAGFPFTLAVSAWTPSLLFVFVFLGWRLRFALYLDSAFARPPSCSGTPPTRRSFGACGRTPVCSFWGHLAQDLTRCYAEIIRNLDLRCFSVASGEIFSQNLTKCPKITQFWPEITITKYGDCADVKYLILLLCLILYRNQS